MKAFFAVVVVLALAFPAAWTQAPANDPVAAPPPPPQRGGPPVPPPPGPSPDKAADREMAGLIESVMTAKLSRELGLNEEQTVLMVRRFSEFREQLNEMKRQRQEKLKTLRAILRDGQPDAAIDAALQDLIAHDLKTLESRKNVYQKAAGSLTTSQRARLYVFISDFEGDIRRLIQKARERQQGMNRPPRMGPPDDMPPMPDGPPRPPRPQRLQRPEPPTPPPPPNPGE